MAITFTATAAGARRRGFLAQNAVFSLNKPSLQDGQKCQYVKRDVNNMPRDAKQQTDKLQPRSDAIKSYKPELQMYRYGRRHDELLKPEVVSRVHRK